MKIKRQLFQPIIQTIPDDAIVFSIINPRSEAGKKLIMENYINFYSFEDFEYNYIVFRFEEFLNLSNISGLEHCFVPISIMKKYNENLEIIEQLLIEEYVIVVPVARKNINFYEKEPEGNHIITIFGIDTEKRVYFCKDFLDNNYVEFEVSFQNMRDGIADYYRPVARELEGLLALRISKNNVSEIEYSKVYSQFLKLQQEYFTYDSGSGVGAIRLFLWDVERRPDDFLKAESWFYTANYLRESAKLMNIRYNILSQSTYIEHKEEGEKLRSNIINNTNKLYLYASKMFLRNALISKDVSNDMRYLVDKCREDYKKIAGYFCSVISGIL